ncbi:MAG: hypothetical protein J6U28_08755 [Bacteroidales bacterium]|nr:hypothetical protein [Bacteroidales bacterium]
MIKTIIIIVLIVLTALSSYGMLKFYRMYEDTRARATENEWDLREVVSYVHHEGWAEHPWGTLPSYARTKAKIDKLYNRFYGEGSSE